MVSIVSESVKLNELELDGNAHSAGSATDGNHWRAEQQQKKDKLRSTAIIDIGFGGATNRGNMDRERNQIISGRG